MRIDELKSYIEICYWVNSRVIGYELGLAEMECEKMIKLSTIISVKKLLKDNADKFLIRDLLLDTTRDEQKQDQIISIIANGSANAFCKAICAELTAVGYEILL